MNFSSLFYWLRMLTVNCVCVYVLKRNSARSPVPTTARTQPQMGGGVDPVLTVYVGPKPGFVTRDDARGHGPRKVDWWDRATGILGAE